MTSPIRRILLVLAALLCLMPPALSSFLRWGGWPPGFAVFPPQLPRDGQGLVIPKPGFSPLYFAVASLFALALLALLIVPTRLGFAAPERVTRRRQAAGRLPWWFWFGTAMNLVWWSVMWFSVSPLVKYSFTPLWWGFILAIDGIVYARTGGASILSRLPRQMLALVAMSVAGWFMFEWLNFFVLENWAYPNAALLTSRTQAYVWFSLTFTCVWPVIFEWYTLLQTFPALTRRWARGPSLRLGTTGLWLLMATGVGLGLLVGFFPYPAFFGIWFAPLFVLAAMMGLLRMWTPFSSIARGDWTPAVLMALAGLASGFFWEFWNYGSNAFLPNRNPHFWIYDIPYVNVIHVFSEMPLLGYIGYLPFGIQCWVWWLLVARVLNFDPAFDPQGAPSTASAGPLPELGPSWVR